MAADYDWVTARIAVGASIDSLYDVQKAQSDGVTHILNVRTNQDEVPWVLKVGLQYSSSPTKDKDEKSKPVEWFRSTQDAIVAALRTENSKILVHCEEGLNRAPGAVYFFLRSIGLDKDTSSALITSARPKTKGYMIWNGDADKAIKALGYK